MEQYLKNFKNCLQKEIPYCTAKCPFHLDIPDFIEKMKRGGFRGAFKVYRDAVGFPLIASELCHEPCKGVCPRQETDSAVELLMLEKACISFTPDRTPTDYNLPVKKKKIAIIGAGISGLACALRLCMKKYEVEIFEATGRIGGYLWELLDPELFQAEIEEQFKHENYKINFYTPVHTADDLKNLGFDAVYVATGEGGEAFGLLAAGSDLLGGDFRRPGNGENRYCSVLHDAGWFAGGGLIGETPVYALANGLNMGTVIDNYLKTGKLLNPENIQDTCMKLDPARLKPEARELPANGISFSEDEAKKEAARCLECQCDFCRTYCDLTDFYSKWPLRIRDEIMATTLPGSADVKATPAKRLLSTCNQCGLCKEVCPEEIDLGGLILEGRKSMHRQKKAPWVFHDYWLRDMDFANGELAAISSPGSCSYAFFPGCQLGAGDPELVTKTYRYLRKKNPDTGLILRCCGAPAEWSGDEEKFEREIAAIQSGWEDLGRPTLILACPTCEKKFKTYMQEIPVISLYEIIEEWGFEPTADRISLEPFADKETDGPAAAKPGEGVTGCEQKIYSVFDACAARHEQGMKEAVRTLAKAAGYQLEPLKKHDEHEQCCGFGGQPGVANPDYAAFVTYKRIAESDAPYITYCINCRDVFLDAGKEAVHILDILFGTPEVPKELPTISRRRENRSLLKRNLLREFCSEEVAESQTGCAKDPESKTRRKVAISGELSQKLSRERILEEDIIEVLDFCERTGRRTFHSESETYSGYREIGRMTYWVEYKKRKGDEAELVNAYAHRMRIELETVWNGRKKDPDQ